MSSYDGQAEKTDKKKRKTAEVPMTGKRQKLVLDENRCFDPEPSVRSLARELYEEIRALPLVCPHGHVDAGLLARNEPFEEPAALFIQPDHYILRMLYSQGLPLEKFGVPGKGGREVESDSRTIWRRFASNYHLFLGTPTRIWLDQEMHDVFDVQWKLDANSADYTYDQIVEQLKAPEFLPRALFDRFNIEVLTTTDSAVDRLQDHQAIRYSGWPGCVIPCFRPDAAMKICSPDWRAHLVRLSQLAGKPVENYHSLREALRLRRRAFKDAGAVSTDHGVEAPSIGKLSESEMDQVFRRALRGQATAADELKFQGQFLLDMALMSVEDGLVMQLHPGSLRNHNRGIFERFGPDMGCDIPVATEFTRNLRELLNLLGNDPRFRLVLFTLDESAYGRELAPLAGHYPCVFLGPPWWFFDSIEGMKRYRKQVTETAGVYNTAGFNDDTRAFLSIPARHDLCRRVDANWVSGLVARHLIDVADARRILQAVTYGQVKRVYRLDRQDSDTQGPLTAG